MNIGTLLPRHARYRPDHLALVFDDQRLTFEQLNRRVNRLACALTRHGVSQGDRIATILPNCVELLDVYWAVAKIGAVVVPLSPLLQETALVGLLRNSGTRLVFADASFAPTLAAIRPHLPGIPPGAYYLTGENTTSDLGSYRQLCAESAETEPPEVSIADADPFNICYSSGTTGEPKGIVHTHYVRAMYCTLFASAWRMTPESVVLHTGSIVFNGAFVTLMPTLYLGATYVLQRTFDPAALVEAVARERVTHTMLVPSQIVALLNEPSFSAAALDSLEMILSLGAPLHLQHKQRLNETLPGRFYELYGLTEGFVTILDREDYPSKPESVGVPPAFSELRIVDQQGRQLAAREVGEIVGRAPILTPGYHARPDLTRQAMRDGWLYTGDMGYVDEEGFLYLVDRQKDMIISGGVNVFPRDIEEVAVQHPAVKEVAVFGVPDAKWGETPIAAVVLKQAACCSSEDLAEWINARVGAKFQRVHKVVLLEDFPRNVAGKTLKRVLREHYVADNGDKK
jgi:acyl-CoA synthetase (AMP-forming)/AMP-acid ligase II